MESGEGRMSVRKREWYTERQKKLIAEGQDPGDKQTAWVVDYSDQHGDRHIKTFDRKREADAYAATVSVNIADGVHTPDSKSITVAEAGRKWIETGENAGLEPTTIEQYQQHLKFHILPYLGKLKLSQLTPPLVRDFEDALRSGRTAPGQEARADAGPRSSAMVRKVIGSLGSLLADAQERGLVAQNVVRGLRGRRKRGKDRSAEKRVRGRLKIGIDIPTMDEIRAIVAHVEGRWRPLLLTAIFTGLRASELRGLTWRDIDLRKNEVHVRQRADRFNQIGPPKSHSGERTVPLSPIVANTLREWKLACPKGELNLVFPNGSGNVESHANIVNRALIPIQTAAGIVDKQGNAKYGGLHCFRHWFASWCINREADGGLELPPKTVQARLGHSSIVMTLDRYGHLFPRGDDGAELAAAEKALFA
jgi:integrase